MSTKTLLVVLAAGALLAGCGGQVGQNDNSGNGATPANKNLELVLGVKNEPFYISLQCGAQAAAKAAGYTINTQAPDQFDPTLQGPIVTALGAKKPAGLLIAPTDDKTMAPQMKQIKDSGTKVVEVDTALQDTSIAASSISSDNTKGGELAAQTMAKLTSGKTGSVLVLDTKAGTSTTAARAKGFEEELKKVAPNLKSAGIQFTDNEPSVAAQKVTAAISSTPDLIGVFATNLNSGEGAATGLRSGGKVGQVQLVGFDASPSEVEGLKSGAFQALIAQDPGTIGKAGVEQAIAAIEGKSVQRNISAPLIALTKDDMTTKSEFFYKTKC
ncbi:ABC transporter substrate-binding protein [Kibdelosporangium phytohabitans]|uniref:Sugar ABC transporter substrate-binding protein n=1 Tax=Kibdelosporangium phytohabitans TaxID=860235 RepID=A0A0N9I5A7_9PSEU|nr:ABC transporter substrate-binding protein [Kibdelosporangium phytohabitans]ALG13244.1 sugar ABC transporter substrate-binding protein [Kibdelosporangium phytohabitans]MBE1465014.1 ribose transport system substrate-binding protein [Kibdelosporangium phytohabitans]